MLKQLKHWTAEEFLANVYYDGCNSSLRHALYTYQLQRKLFLT